MTNGANGQTPTHRLHEPWPLRLLALEVAVLLGLGCGGQEVKRRSRRGAPSSGGGQEAMAANLSDVGKPSADLVADKLPGPKKKKRKRRRRRRDLRSELPKPDPFTERDFVDNPQESRDPFRNLLAQQAIGQEPSGILKTDVVYLKSYGISELKVTGIVGGYRRYAMIRDPKTSRTAILRKRDRIARERAIIFDIKRDHIVLLIPRLKPGKKEPFERLVKYVDEKQRALTVKTEPLRPDESGIRYSSSHWRKSSRRGGSGKEP